MALRCKTYQALDNTGHHSLGNIILRRQRAGVGFRAYGPTALKVLHPHAVPEVGVKQEKPPQARGLCHPLAPGKKRAPSLVCENASLVEHVRISCVNLSCLEFEKG